MDSEELKRRTNFFALQVIRLIESLPPKQSVKIVGNQLLRSATSVAANYRSACKARSKADFVSKITIVEEEADESQFWLELMMEAGLVQESVVLPLYREARELTAIFTSSGETAKQGLHRHKNS